MEHFALNATIYIYIYTSAPALHTNSQSTIALAAQSDSLIDWHITHLHNKQSTWNLVYITVNTVVNNVVLENNLRQYVLAISETGRYRYKAMKLGEVKENYNFDNTYQHVNNDVFFLKQPDTIHYDGDIDGHVTHSYNH